MVDAKLHLRVDFPDDDALISPLITAARSVCETRLRQALITQTVALYMDMFPWGGGYLNRQIRQMGPSTPYWLPSSTFPIDLPKPPVQSIVSVQYWDYNNVLQTVDPAIYNFEVGIPARIAPLFGKVWPIAQPRPGSVIITYVVGYGMNATDVPINIVAAMKLLIGSWYEHREHVNIGQYVEIPETVDALLSASDQGAYA